VQQRENRVHRYGQSPASGSLLGLRKDGGGNDFSQPAYAMFNSKKSTRGTVPAASTSGPELRRRHGSGAPSSDPSKYYASSPYLDKESSDSTAESSKQLHQQKVKQSKSRQEASKHIEKTVAEVIERVTETFVTDFFVSL
jgi:hypothetical protein